MSEGQKKRRYGASAVPSGGEGNRTPGTAGRSRGSAQPTGRSSTRTPVAPGTYRREDLAPRPGSGSSLGIIIGVLTTIAVLLFCYVTFLVLPGIGRAYGLTLPELRITGFDREQIAAAASALGDQGWEDYRWVHRSSGLLMPLFMALAWFAMLGQSVHTRAVRWALWSVPLAFAVVVLAGGHAIDAALADPTDGPVALASGLVIARWVLTAALLAQAAWMLAHLVRTKLDAFARGELPGQQPTP